MEKPSVLCLALQDTPKSNLVRLMTVHHFLLFDNPSITYTANIFTHDFMKYNSWSLHQSNKAVTYVVKPNIYRAYKPRA